MSDLNSQHKRNAREANRIRSKVWKELGVRLHQILDLTLKEQRPALEAAHANGYGLTLFVRVSHPDDVGLTPEPAPANNDAEADGA